MFNSDTLKAKWAPIMEAAEAPAFADSHREAVTAVLLENTEKALAEERGQQQYLAETPTNATGGAISNWDPILISLVRRAMPNLIAYDLCGVQPMTGPTGLVFAMKSKYADNADRLLATEAFHNEPNSGYSNDNAAGGLSNGDQSGSSSLLGDFGSVTAGAFVVGDTYRIAVPGTTDFTLIGAADSLAGTEFVATGVGAGTGTALTISSGAFGTGMSLGESEALGSTGGEFAEMSFTIEKSTVTAKSRALKAEYTMELAQDLKAIHGLDAESELANILSGEILAEINREVVRTINSRAKLGAQQSEIAVRGQFDLAVDADGRWSVEKYKGLLVHIQREANKIAQDTRRGKGNFILVSSDVAAVLSASGMLDYTPALAGNATVKSDVTGTTMVGTISGGVKVYLDPYATDNYVTVGYKGTSAYDAGMFYCPYVPLTMVRAVGENTFQPKIGFKTRYGMIANPFVAVDGIGAVRTNTYYRIFAVKNILTEA